jgi:hypothetical protein
MSQSRHRNMWVFNDNRRNHTTYRLHVLITLPLHGPRLLIRQVCYLLISQLTYISFFGRFPIRHLGRG